MIKAEEQAYGQPYFCFNPFCSDSNNRKFQPNDRHFMREQCRKWIIASSSLFLDRVEPLNMKIINNLEVDFENQPIEAFRILQRLKQSDWEKVMDGEEAKIRKEVTRAIEVEFEAVKIKIREIINSSLLFNQISYLLTSQPEPSQSVNQFYDEHLQELRMLDSKVLFKRIHLKERVVQIKRQINMIFSSIIEGQTAKSNVLSHQEQRTFHEYIFEQSSEYFNKLQVLASALKKSTPALAIEGEKMTLKCCVCDRQMHAVVHPANKKGVKKYLAEQILMHMYSDHYEEVGFAYCRKVEKTHLADLKFQEFLEVSKGCTKIVIVDRESGVVFKQKYEELKKGEKKFVIEIVSLKNAAAAKGKHILVHNHQSIDSMIAIIAYLCTQNDQDIQIVTNKPHLKKGIEDLLQCKAKQEKTQA